MKYFLIIIFLCYGTIACPQGTIKNVKVKKPTPFVKPDTCSAAMLGIPGGYISKNQLQLCSKIETVVCFYKIESFQFGISGKDGRPFFLKSDTGAYFSGENKTVLQSIGPGMRFFIRDIKARNLVSGQEVTLPNLTFKVK